MSLADVYIFDIDGTLTAPRQPIDEEFSSFFLSFAKKHEVFLATGSDKAKVLEQLPVEILHACHGYFTCMGNELWINDEKIYSRKLKIPTNVLEWLKQQIEDSRYPHKQNFGKTHFEYRSGMLNFSVSGRDISQEQRKLYYQWDVIEGERKFLARRFNELFKDYDLEAFVGGQISIDIQKKGKDKGQIYDYLSNYERKIFFGDKCYPGGNDYSLAKKCEVKFAVQNWKDTQKILQDFILPLS